MVIKQEKIMPKILKDVYEAAPRRLPRWLIAIAIPFCMGAGFFTVLFRDIGRAFRAAWLEALIEFESAMRYWRL
jgi:hypothetical protein